MKFQLVNESNIHLPTVKFSKDIYWKFKKKNT